MPKRKTWKVLRWEKEPEHIQGWVPLECENCGTVAECPHGPMGGAIIIAGGGMGFIFDGIMPPDGWLPDEVACRRCRRIFGNWGSARPVKEEVSDVR